MTRILPLLVLLTACFGSSEEGGSGPSAALVSVATATSGGLSDTWSLPGDVRALDEAELAAAATGRVLSVAVREGEAVTEDQVLLQIDAAAARGRALSAQGALEETEAELAKARRDLKRLSQVSDAVLSAAEKDAAEALVATLEARLLSRRGALAEARATLADHTVRSSLTGVVSARYVDPGDWVSIGTPVLDVISVDAVDVRVDATRALARQVKAGDPVTLGAVGGSVAAVVPALDPTTRTSTIRLVPSGPHDLVPGSVVEVDFKVKRTQEGGALVPRDALLLGPVDTKVARVAEGHAELVVVDVIATTADQALVTGINPDDQVVVRGGERLRPGQALRIAEPGSGPPTETLP